jgi:hypothetical protein
MSMEGMYYVSNVTQFRAVLVGNVARNGPLCRVFVALIVLTGVPIWTGGLEIKASVVISSESFKSTKSVYHV